MKVRKWKQKLFLYSCINPISILPSSDWSKNLMVCSDDRFRVGVRVVPHVDYIMLQHEKEKEIQIQVTHVYRCNYIHFQVWGFELCSSYFKIILGKELIIFACQFKTLSYQVPSFVFNEIFSVISFLVVWKLNDGLVESCLGTFLLAVAPWAKENAMKKRRVRTVVSFKI